MIKDFFRAVVHIQGGAAAQLDAADQVGQSVRIYPQGRGQGGGSGKIASLLLERQIYLNFRIVPGGDHSEASWERQIPFFMETLMYEPPGKPKDQEPKKQDKK